MNKNEFMRKLKDGLVGLNQTDKREILLDYEEHFLDGIKLGRTEEEICESLGDPVEIAANIKKEGRSASETANDGVNTAAYIIGIIALAVGSLWLVGFAFNVLGALFGAFIGIFAVLAFPLTVGVKILAVSALVLTIAVSTMIILGLIMLCIMILRWFKQMINGLTKDEDKKIKREFKMFKVKGMVWVTLAIIAVLAFGGILYGALSTGAGVARAAFNGDFNTFINSVEGMEDIDSESEFFEFVEENEDFPFGLIFDESKVNASDFRFTTWFGGRKMINQTEGLDMTNVDTVIISAGSAGIDVIGGGKAEAKLTGRSRYGTEKLEVSKSGSMLEIKVIPAFGPFNNGWVNLDVTLPDEILENVTVKNASGSIEVEGVMAEALEVMGSSGSIKIDGDGYAYDVLSVDNTSGKITVEDVTDAQVVYVENTSGTIVLNNIVCDSLKVKNTSGRIEGQMLEGDMEVTNTSGTISLYADLGEGASTVRCSSGRIELSLKQEPMDITANATSGSISVAENELLLVSMDSRTGYVGEYADESVSTPSIEVKATSGNVDILFH